MEPEVSSLEVTISVPQADGGRGITVQIVINSDDQYFYDAVDGALVSQHGLHLAALRGNTDRWLVASGPGRAPAFLWEETSVQDLRRSVRSLAPGRPPVALDTAARTTNPDAEDMESQAPEPTLRAGKWLDQ